jgi:hypothetical protein
LLDAPAIPLRVPVNVIGAGVRPGLRKALPNVAIF